jgi:hypothetical protein
MHEISWIEKLRTRENDKSSKKAIHLYTLNWLYWFYSCHIQIINGPSEEGVPVPRNWTIIGNMRYIELKS